MSPRSIERAIALVEALTPETIGLLRGTETARNAAELKRLADEPAERQSLIAQVLREGKAATVAAARIQAGVAPAGEADPQETLFRSMVSGWARMDRKTRARFLDHAGLAERKPRERMPKISEVIGDARQIDLDEAIAATRKGRA